MDSLDLNLLPERNCYNWILVKIEPLENLVEYKNHKRLTVFYHKGVTCALCGKEHGAYIAHYQAPKGDVHIDVYTKDGVMINRDHIIPRSKGGANKLSNLQPTCEPCNTKKGNGDTLEEKVLKKQQREVYSKRFEIGDVVKFKKADNNKGSKMIFKVMEVKTKGEVILNGDNGTFKIAQSKIERYKIHIGDNVTLKGEEEIYRVDSYDEESIVGLRLKIVDTNGNTLVRHQKHLKKIHLLKENLVETTN